MNKLASMSVAAVLLLGAAVASAGAQKITPTADAAARARGMTPVLDSVALGLKKQMKTAADTSADSTGKKGASNAACDPKKDKNCCDKKDPKCAAKDAKVK